MKPHVVSHGGWRFVLAAVERIGPIDVVIRNDCFPAIHSSFELPSADGLHSTLDPLVISPFRLLQAAVVRMKQRGRGRFTIITTCRTELLKPCKAGICHPLAMDLQNHQRPNMAIGGITPMQRLARAA